MIITVTDQVGSVVPGAEVVVGTTTGGAVGHAKTDGRGEARFSLEQGSYEFSATYPGFAKLIMRNQVVGEGESRLRLILQIGPVSYPIRVADSLGDIPITASEPLHGLIATMPYKGTLVLHAMSRNKFAGAR